MNLIAKEFIASKTDGKGVLILSEMTGAASELGEALIVNANNKAAIGKAIKQALEMPVLEQIERNRLMQERLCRYDVTRWSNDFLNALSTIKQTQLKLSIRKLTQSARKKLISDYLKSEKRLLLLDYDGTLVAFKARPTQAGPDDEIIDLLRKLSSDPKNKVVIISGRDKNTLEEWLKNLTVDLVAEHGAWIMQQGSNWQGVEHHSNAWKNSIKPILEIYSDRTPGSSVEEKDFSLVWHYRRADPELASVRTQELKNTLLNLTENLSVGVFEVKSLTISKGRAAKYWISKQNWDFLLAAGDDYTDEEMFDILPDKAYSIRVGTVMSKARFNVDGVNDIRALLKDLIGD
jgi:trehalose 6-phosphate synthase/phosphatase